MNQKNSIDWMIELDKPKIWNRSFFAWTYLFFCETQIMIALFLYPEMLSLAYIFLAGIFFANWLSDKQHQKNKAMIIASLRFIEFLLLKLQEEGILLNKRTFKDEWED